MLSQITLVEFNPVAEIMHLVHVAENLGNYDIIIGWYLLHELVIDINSSAKAVCWNKVEIDMKKIRVQKKTCSTWDKNCLFQTKQITLQKL